MIASPFSTRYSTSCPSMALPLRPVACRSPLWMGLFNTHQINWLYPSYAECRALDNTHLSPPSLWVILYPHFASPQAGWLGEVWQLQVSFLPTSTFSHQVGGVIELPQ